MESISYNMPGTSTTTTSSIPTSSRVPPINMPINNLKPSQRGKASTTNTPVSPRCSTPDVGGRDKPKKKDRNKADPHTYDPKPIPSPYVTPERSPRDPHSSPFALPLGSQVAKRVLAEAEQSEKALEQIFGELLAQMNIKDDLKAQMRTWDEGKKMTLLRQQRNSVANIKKDANKSGFQKYFDSCPLKVSILASRGIPNEFLDIYAEIHTKDETYRTTTPWKLPFACELVCRDLMSVLKVQVFRRSPGDANNDPFMGEITFIMDALADDTVHTRWFDLKPMQGRKDAVSGKLQLSIHLMVDKGKLMGVNSDKPVSGKQDIKPKGVLNLSPLSEEWVLMQNLIANSEAENAIKESVNLLYDHIELDDEQLARFEDDVFEADAVWMDKIVALGGLAWTLDHIGYLCYKLKSRRTQERDKQKVERLVSIVRKMLVSKTIINRLTNTPGALSILLDALDHINPAKQTEVFQMLIACQECKQYSGDLGDALENMLNSNKRLFCSLLHELEKGKDLKFKEVFLTFMNITLTNMRQLSKKIYVRALCITLGLSELLLMGVARIYLVPEIARQVEQFLLDIDRDKKEITVSQNVDEQDFSHKLLKNLKFGFNQ
jgi:hypothetical protein